MLRASPNLYFSSFADEPHFLRITYTVFKYFYYCSFLLVFILSSFSERFNRIGLAIYFYRDEEHLAELMTLQRLLGEVYRQIIEDFVFFSRGELRTESLRIWVEERRAEPGLMGLSKTKDLEGCISKLVFDLNYCFIIIYQYYINKISKFSVNSLLSLEHCKLLFQHIFYHRILFLCETCFASFQTSHVFLFLPRFLNPDSTRRVWSQESVGVLPLYLVFLFHSDFQIDHWTFCSWGYWHLFFRQASIEFKGLVFGFCKRVFGKGFRRGQIMMAIWSNFDGLGRKLTVLSCWVWRHFFIGFINFVDCLQILIVDDWIYVQRIDSFRFNHLAYEVFRIRFSRHRGSTAWDWVYLAFTLGPFDLFLSRYGFVGCRFLDRLFQFSASVPTF